MLLITLIICAAIFSAGCTQNSSSQVPVTLVTTSAPVANPAQLALTQSDVPQGFTLVESKAKTYADVSKLALDIGWQDGYMVRFINPVQDARGANEIVQSIAIYPERTIKDVIAMAEQQGRSDIDLTYTDIPVQGLGNNARAFYGKANAQILLKPTPANQLIPGMDKNAVPAIFKNDVAEIIFSKGNTVEVLIMTGPSPDTALLIELAKKAYAKIP
ncbi:MAG: hypothetical protein Q7U51_07145 [Methanoregula sp.]|nr:hypothetical protein [Methanoregula sp.]